MISLDWSDLQFVILSSSFQCSNIIPSIFFSAHTLLYLSLRTSYAMPASWFHTLPPTSLDYMSLCLGHKSLYLLSSHPPFMFRVYKRASYYLVDISQIIYFGKPTLRQLIFTATNTTQDVTNSRQVPENYSSKSKVILLHSAYGV